MSIITAWRVRWIELSHSPKTDSDRLIKDNRIAFVSKLWCDSISFHNNYKNVKTQKAHSNHPIHFSTITQEQSNKRERERGVAVGGCHSSVAEHWRLKLEVLGLIPGGATFLSFPLLFHRSTDNNNPDCLWLDDHYRFSDCGGVPSIGLPMQWLHSPSIMIMIVYYFYKLLPQYYHTVHVCTLASKSMPGW